MDLFTQNQIVTGLTLLIEDCLSFDSNKENKEARLYTAQCALQTAQELDYFPSEELARLKRLYPLVVVIPRSN